FSSLTPTPRIDLYTLSLHVALPILDEEQPADHDPGHGAVGRRGHHRRLRARPLAVLRRQLVRHRHLRHLPGADVAPVPAAGPGQDRKSTRLNSSHVSISYAVLCLKK